MTTAPAFRNPALDPMRTRIFTFALMCIGYFMALLDIQIVASSLKDIGGGLSASQDELSWVQTAYLIAEIMVIPMSGWLTKVFSTRWLFTVSALGFTVTSMLCGLAWDINSMILFRGLQGALGAAMIPTVFTTAFVLFPEPKQRIYAATTVGTLASLAPTIGPVVGGWITSEWSWHWLFYMNVLPGIILTVLVPKYIHIDEADTSLLKKGDYIGIVLMSTFLGCLEYVLEEGPRKNWFGDDVILACTWISGISAFLFLVHAFTAKDPIVDLRALAVRNFGIGSLLSFITGIGLFCSVFLTPVFLGRVRGLDSLQIGFAMLSVGLFQILGTVAYPILAPRIGLKNILFVGLALFGLSMVFYIPLTNQAGWQELLLPQALRGFSQPWCVAPVVTMALGALPPSRLKSASGLFNLMRNLGGAIGIAVCSTMLNDRLNLHYQRLDEHVTVGKPVVESLLQQQATHLAAMGGNAISGVGSTLSLLHSLIMREALVMTFSDCFYMVAICMAVGLASVFFTKPFGNTPPPPEAH
jgi:DHA2 family multidrug resistance protein